MHMQMTPQASPPRPARSSGFTLIELLIAIAIIAILTAIAVPSYKTFIRKGYRAAAQATMMDLANREEQFLLANRTYASKTAVTASGFALPDDVARSYTWDIALGSGNLPTFVITFTAIGEQLVDGDLTLDNAGVKGPADKW